MFTPKTQSEEQIARTPSVDDFIGDLAMQVDGEAVEFWLEGLGKEEREEAIVEAFLLRRALPRLFAELGLSSPQDVQELINLVCEDVALSAEEWGLGEY